LNLPFDGLEIRETGGVCVFEVRVTPRSSHNKVVGVKEGKLYLKINAPALEGAANERTIEFLAELLDRPKRDIELSKGHHSRIKIFKIHGIRVDQVRQALEKGTL
jgi:uncharacterized protein (TIGR00251 family)